MVSKVELSIVLPLKTYVTRSVSSALIPAIHADVDILPDRAPSIFVLDYGLVQLADEMGETKERYFIKSGIADVSDNKCRIMTSFAIPFNEITADLAKQKAEAAEKDDDKLFYEMIGDYLNGVRRRYLRTLNVFKDKELPTKDYREQMDDIRYQLDQLKKVFEQYEEE